MPTLVTALQRYLHETLGISIPGYQPWERGKELPYFLQDAFDFWEVPLLGQRIVLAMDRSPILSRRTSLTWTKMLNKVNAAKQFKVAYPQKKSRLASA